MHAYLAEHQSSLAPCDFFFNFALYLYHSVQLDILPHLIFNAFNATVLLLRCSRRIWFKCP